MADTTSERICDNPPRSVCESPCSSMPTSEKRRESTSPCWRWEYQACGSVCILTNISRRSWRTTDALT